MTIPAHTFTYENSDFMAYPPNPFPAGRWLEENAARFLYSRGHIVREAIPYVIADIPSHNAGIYFLLLGESIVYAGLAIDLHRRIQQHDSIVRPFDRFWCFGGVPEMYLADVEAFYIHTLRPAWNKKYPTYFDDMKPFIVRAKKGELEYPNV